ncbi:MAG: LuxR C-terminal-related transcriptional regulator [Lawsonibacter sp.]
MSADYIWLSIEREESSAQMIWDSLMRQLVRTTPELGNQLRTLGFPSDTAQLDKIKQIIEDQVYLSNIVLVIDDYHLAHAPKLDEFLKNIVKANIDGFHMLILSRTIPELSVEELLLKHYCYVIKNACFEFNNEEIGSYFYLYGFQLPNKSIKRVYTISEGWISAVYLLMQRYAETGLLDSRKSIEHLIESAVMPRYSDYEIMLLKSMCLFEAFTPQQAVYITGEKAAADTMFHLSESNSFIHFDEQNGVFRIHNIFNDYLKKLLTNQPLTIELDTLYERSGTWCIQNGDMLSGLQYYHRGKKYNFILEQFEKFSFTKVFDSSPDIVQRLFNGISDEIKYRHPIAYIAYIGFYVTNVDIVEGEALLSEVEVQYQNDPVFSSEMKRRIIGEITMIRAYTAFNDAPLMYDRFQAAHELLDGQSHIANKNKIVTFGSPHILYTYYRNSKNILWTIEWLEKLSPYYVDLSGGCGMGFDYQIRAEYYLETGDFEQAELYAYKAIYKARTADQMSVIICSNLVLMRICALKGSFEEALDILDSLYAEVEMLNSPILSSAADLCAGYIYGVKGEENGFANWLRCGNFEKSDVLYQGSGFNYIVYGKYLLLKKEYIRLEVLVEEMLSIFSVFDNRLGYLHAYLFDAAVKYKLYGYETALPSLISALDISREDRIVLPFVEYSPYLLDMLRTLNSGSEQDDYLSCVIELAQRYTEKLNIRTEIPAPKLTERENRMIKLVAQGVTNREIASELYIAEVTVRKTLTSIYRKLDVSGRTAAVKKAIELHLI